MPPNVSQCVFMVLIIIVHRITIIKLLRSKFDFLKQNQDSRLRLSSHECQWLTEFTEIFPHNSTFSPNYN